MTGFGKSACEAAGKKVIAEIRSLNGKQLDISTKITSLFREKEPEIRNTLSHALQRGKIELSLYFEMSDENKSLQINADVVRNYIAQLEAIAEASAIDVTGELLQTAMSLPDTLKTEKNILSEKEWQTVSGCITDAVKEVIAFREQEGKALEVDIRRSMAIIQDLLEKTGEYEKDRLNGIRSRIMQNLKELEVNGPIDTGRFEQEMIYYLEKLDINEEKVRLRNHCDYFLQTMENQEPVGRKLGFIIQEMGREINTLGSKASDSNIQRLVVDMKDELEKIREQVNNIL
jgi:uncharacterized protein (TIGR00255 family)